jgi:hypothetical protein
LELALNFAWLGISCVLLIWGIPFVKKQGIARRRLVAAMALVCVLCLLFPVISMTDDLHNTPAVVENKEMKKLVVVGQVLAALLSWFSLQAMLKPVAIGENNCEDLFFPAQPLFTLDLSNRPPPISRAWLFV